MRRPAQQHRPGIPAAYAWTHPYTGVQSMAVFYNDGGDPPAGGDPAAEPPKPGPPPSRVFTQDEVASLAAKEKAQGERAGARKALEDLAAKLGFSKIEDAEAFIEAGRKAQEAALSEDEKRRAELDRREQELAAKEAAAVTRERAAIRRSILVGLGATGDDLDDAAALLRVDDDADEQAVQDAAEKLKTRRPELFGTTTAPAPAPQTLPPAPSGAPAGGGLPRTPAAGKDAIRAAARERAERMGLRNPEAA
ncbi:hypothetical protein [Streptomyces sp. t39]|uniref:hypothetical protein n=1 Tax=Streptomyces sp. t39 TaxID=1828156 RepID=UPI0011CE3D61|nr:hypothetical protein [Streptomyces sp. t39]TXS42931.1 hypothetical protein EAO77_35330 [Streptomyces sp. t39]